MERLMLGLERFVAWVVWQTWLAPAELIDSIQGGLERLGAPGASDRLISLARWVDRRLADPLTWLERRLCAWAEVFGRSPD